MAYRIQFRRDTSTNWESNNPILLQGEFGYELDTGFAKIGDGSSTWDQLTYFGGTGPTGPIGSIGPTGATGSIGVTGSTGPSVSSIAPGSSGATGTIGDLALDTNYLYVCIGTNTWKRTQITGW
jgi:hyaluronoglucosaminidase